MSTSTQWRLLAAESDRKGSNIQSAISRFFGGNAFALLILLAINLICSGETLGMFFFAEDSEHVAHAYGAFNGLPHFFFSNFWSAWQNQTDILFYRPLSELTFATDWLLYGTNPVGYHLTNLLWHLATTVALFFLVSSLLRQFGANTARTTALITCALFSANPLHSEAVIWLVNRTDLICTFFIMMSAFFFSAAIQGTRGLNTSAFISMTIALFCKESAIAIPPLLVAVHLFLTAKKITFASLKDTMKETAPFWLLLIAYAGFRLVMFHGPGGYSASGGTLLADTLWQRLASNAYWTRCVYPINEFVQPELYSLLTNLFSAAYATAALLLAARLLSGWWNHSNTRLFLFAVAATLITLAPAVQPWGMNASLYNSRLVYIPSAFFALICASIVLPIGVAASKSRPLWKAGIVWSLFTTIVFCAGHLTNNKFWSVSSENMKLVWKALEEKVRALPPNESLSILNVPLDERNALTMNFYQQLRLPVKPPFCKEDFSARVSATQHDFFSADVRNASRINDFVSVQTNHGYLWDSATKQLVPCAKGDFPSAGVTLDKSTAESRQNPHPGHEPILIYNLPTSGVDARLAGAIKVTMSPRSSASLKPNSLACCTLHWTSYDRPEVVVQKALFKYADESNPNIVYFPVAEYIRWRLSPQPLKQLMVIPADGYEVKAVELTNDSCIVPMLAVEDSHRITTTGVCNLDEPLAIVFDTTRLEAAETALMEISTPDVQFHNQGNTFRETKLSKHAKQIKLPTRSGRFVLTRNMFEGKGRYDVRIAAMKGDRIVGYTSDPVQVAVR